MSFPLWGKEKMCYDSLLFYFSILWFFKVCGVCGHWVCVGGGGWILWVKFSELSTGTSVAKLCLGKLVHESGWWNWIDQIRSMGQIHIENKRAQSYCFQWNSMKSSIIIKHYNIKWYYVLYHIWQPWNWQNKWKNLSAQSFFFTELLHWYWYRCWNL